MIGQIEEGDTKGGILIPKDRSGHLVGKAMRTIPEEDFELIRKVIEK